MQFFTSYLLPLSALLLPVLGRPNGIERRQVPNNAIPPSRDPWYTAPAGFELAAPGTILRIRTDPSNITAIVAEASAAYNILFRTTDTLYRPSWAVTTFLVPKKPVGRSGNSSSKAALLSYQIPYNTADVDGSPSYLLSTEGAMALFGVPAPTDDITEALSRGWYVNVPDHEGPLASFLSGPQEGHIVIDSVRAVLSSKAFHGTPSDTRSALWGYSGGSFASTFAAEVQASYASELDFAGMAIGGLVPNVTEVLGDSQSQASPVIPAGLLGITSEYPKARQFLLGQLKTEGPYNATGFLATLHYSAGEAFATYAGQDMNDYFVRGLQGLVDAPELARVFGNNGFQGYHGIPQMPVFAYKAVHDEATNGIAASDAVITRYCDVGANILYRRNSIGGHSDEAYNGRPAALEFLSAVLDGSYAQRYNTTGCTWVDVSINVTAPATS
ncbi:LIP-domain-containing protein [Xylariaceae sp. FL1651]|nr:LIP-domain-containing protein [Xylariaceae sp. FL1651]